MKFLFLPSEIFAIENHRWTLNLKKGGWRPQLCSGLALHQAGREGKGKVDK